MQNRDMLIKIGKVIRKHREALLQTQEEFADAHDFNRPYYGAIERGKQNLTLLNMLRIADGLKRPLSQLLREAEKMSIDVALAQETRPPRRGRPPGRRAE